MLYLQTCEINIADTDFYRLLTMTLFLYQQMQSTIREHRDNGQAGGIFSRYNIIKIQKVRNKKMWERYLHRKKEVADENHSHDNERMLFHGKLSSCLIIASHLI